MTSRKDEEYTGNIFEEFKCQVHLDSCKSLNRIVFQVMREIYVGVKRNNIFMKRIKITNLYVQFSLQCEMIRGLQISILRTSTLTLKKDRNV